MKHHLRILLFTFFIVLTVGYRFGAGDQNSHFPFLFKDFDPSLYPGDSFIDLKNGHYSYFWNLFLPLLKLGFSLEISSFIVFVFSLFLLFLAYYQLIFFFTKNKSTAYLGLLAFIVPAFSFSIFPTHETYLVNRTFALPFLVWAIVFFLQNRNFLAFSLLGFIYNFHALSATFVVAMLILALFGEIYYKRVKFHTLLTCSTIFLFFALPVLVWRFGQSGLDLSLNPNWFSLVSKGALGHIFHLFTLNPPTIILSLLGIGNTLVFIWVWYQKKKNHQIDISDTKLMFFMLAIYLVLFVGVITAEFLPLTTAIQFQLSRIGQFIPIISYPYFIGYLSWQLKKENISRASFIRYVLSVNLFLCLVLPLVFYLLEKKQKILQSRLLFSFGIVIVLIIAFFSIKNIGVWKPGVYIYPQKSDWYDLQIWARNNTTKNALFITPVNKWDHYIPDFMMFSHRSTLVTLGQLMEIAFHPQYIDTWTERFEDLVPGAIATFNGNFITNGKNAKAIYQKNTTADFLRLAAKYQASYVVVEKPARLDMEIAYENQQYIVYKVK